MKTQKYKYLFRLDGGEIVLVPHATRPGDAENCARKLAKLVAKREKVSEAVCIWKGPEEQRIPAEIREEIEKEAVS